MHIQKFIAFSENLNEKRKKKKPADETSSYPPPEYLVEPAKDDKGFFMLKAEFDKKKKRFDTGVFY